VITSQLTLAECLVKPYQTGSKPSVNIYEQTIRPRRWLTIVPVSREVLVEAAKTRAKLLTKLPDAIHIASFRLQRADVLLTNDHRIKSALGDACLLLEQAG
jgi:predicted nucleic acid-binding protein